MERKDVFFTRTKARLGYYWTDHCLFFMHLRISIGEKPKRDTILISDRYLKCTKKISGSSLTQTVLYDRTVRASPLRLDIKTLKDNLKPSL